LVTYETFPLTNKFVQIAKKKKKLKNITKYFPFSFRNLEAYIEGSDLMCLGC
jgi:hypothetical protein